MIFTPYVYTLITTIFQGKKYKIFVPFQNGGQITYFHFASFRFRPKFEKTTFQWNLAQIRRTWIHSHCWNKIWIILFRGDFRGKSIFPRPPPRLIYANLRKKRRGGPHFFFHQKKRNYYSGNYKNYQPEILRRLNARAEKPNVGYHGTPPLCS